MERRHRSQRQEHAGKNGATLGGTKWTYRSGNTFADVNLMEKDGRTPLARAARNGHGEVVKQLLTAGADVNIMDEDGKTSLHWAVSNKYPKVIEMLLDAGADVNIMDEDGKTSLHLAVSNEYPKGIEMLLDAGADVNMNKDGQTPLCWAARCGSIKVIEILLDAGADVNIMNKDGQTPLCCAARCGSIKVIEILLDAGADVNVMDKDGQTPMYWAARCGSTKVIEMLLDAGVDVNIMNKDGQTPLYWAARCGSIKVIEMLLDAGADVNVMDKEGQTPLYWAVRCGYDKEVVQLLTVGADVNIMDKDGQTPLYWAARRGSTKVIEMLLDAGAEVDRKLEDTKTLVFWTNYLTEQSPKFRKWTPGMSPWLRIQFIVLERFQDVLKLRATEVDIIDGNDRGILEVLWSAPKRLRAPIDLFHSLSLTSHETPSGHLISANTIGEELKRWPVIGSMVLNFYEKALMHDLSKSPFTLSGQAQNSGSEFHFVATAEVLSVVFTCATVHHEELRECLIWLEQVVGCPEEGLWVRKFRPICRKTGPPQIGDKSVRSCDAFVTIATSENRTEALSEIRKFSMYVDQPTLVIAWELERKIVVSDTLCWKRLIHAAYVAEGERLDREQPGVGLKMSFQLMVELAAVEREILYDGGIVLTGYDTAVVPTGKVDESVQWHVVYQEASERRSWFKSDGSCLFDVANRVKETSLDELKGDAYLGWGNEVNVTLGTDNIQLPGVERSPLKESGDQYVRTGYSRGGTFGIGLSSLAKLLNVNVTGSYTDTFSRARACQTRSLHKNYQRRFRDLYVQMVILYDTKNGRAWLVPKVNLVLLLVRMYMASASLTTPLRIDYPVRRSENRKSLDRAAWSVIESLEQKPIETQNPTASEPTFGTLFNDFGEDLHNAVDPLEAYVQSSIQGIELIDIYDGKFGIFKKVPDDTVGLHQWSPIVRHVGIVLCHGLGAALELTSAKEQAESEWFLWKSNSLCCVVGDLKLLMESQGCTNWGSHTQTGRIENRDVWKWVLKNNPFDDTCGRDERCTKECWQTRTQCIEKWSNWIDHYGNTIPPFTLSNMNSGICFGCLRGQL
jgi:ankyrin repeat protein